MWAAWLVDHRDEVKLLMAMLTWEMRGLASGFMVRLGLWVQREKVG